MYLMYLLTPHPIGFKEDAATPPSDSESCLVQSPGSKKKGKENSYKNNKPTYYNNKM